MLGLIVRKLSASKYCCSGFIKSKVCEYLQYISIIFYGVAINASFIINTAMFCLDE